MSSVNNVLIGFSGERQVPQQRSFVLQSITLEAVGEVFHYFILVMVVALVTKEMYFRSVLSHLQIM